MILRITVELQHPAHIDDRLFFRSYPNRKYRARPHVSGEGGVVLFAADELDCLGEVNLTIVERIAGGRESRFFNTCKPYPHDSDTVIEAFLCKRGVKRGSQTTCGVQRNA